MKIRKTYKTLTTVLAILSSFIVLTACSGGNSGGPADAASANEANDKSAEGKVVLNYWTWWGSETRRPIIEKLVDDFNKSQDKKFM
ncbi:hypothetical protein [Paenibacillus sp. SN-8-1]|uniref:hypothetical protein n=1 Tax=Paenibacillus sp. SN-8-1 TaxID=3435409 RepID=UPI003D9A758A